MKEVSEEHWKVVQTKTFTKWINSKLIKALLPPVGDLVREVGTGIPLINLLQAMGLVELKHNTAPKSRIARMENVSFVLDFIKERGVPLVKIGSADIVDGNSKLILGLIWTVIVEYVISPSKLSSYLDLSGLFF